MQFKTLIEILSKIGNYVLNYVRFNLYLRLSDHPWDQVIYQARQFISSLHVRNAGPGIVALLFVFVFVISIILSSYAFLKCMALFQLLNINSAHMTGFCWTIDIYEHNLNFKNCTSTLHNSFTKVVQRCDDKSSVANINKKQTTTETQLCVSHCIS